MHFTDEQKRHYIDMVYRELSRRGFSESEIPRIIARTGFLSVVEEYPDVQLMYPIENAADEIMETALHSLLKDQES